jgi:hypothetical protein
MKKGATAPPSQPPVVARARQEVLIQRGDFLIKQNLRVQIGFRTLSGPIHARPHATNYSDRIN